MIKGLLFDKDATLLDFHKTWGAWARGYLSDLAQGDKALFQTLCAAVMYDPETASFDPQSPVIAGTPEEGVDLIHPHLPGWEREALMAHSHRSAVEAPVAAVVPLAPLLDGLKPNYKLGIATNDGAAPARMHMEALGVADRFDAIIGSDSGYGGKPAPGMCLGFAQEVGLEPAQVAMIGDSLHDLHAGRAAGMVCVGVQSGFATRKELAPHADIVLEDVSHLPDWLNAT